MAILAIKNRQFKYKFLISTGSKDVQGSLILLSLEERDNISSEDYSYAKKLYRYLRYKLNRLLSLLLYNLSIAMFVCNKVSIIKKVDSPPSPLPPPSSLLLSLNKKWILLQYCNEVYVLQVFSVVFPV